uniref:Pentacotripeptide-repeat region of PRORP domain-containing protein n=2 Tax=Selaginella moellendorffii TaxID=88036 RepID=D8SH09_SELML|nr:hypothetical protein SELMODRAFT_421999 [Selaginella moellendorffii]
MRGWMLLRRISQAGQCSLLRRDASSDRSFSSILAARAHSFSVSSRSAEEQDDFSDTDTGFAHKLAKQAAKMESPKLVDLCNKIAALRPRDSGHVVPMLKEWEEEGNVLDKEMLRAIMLKLRKWKRGSLALEVADWMYYTKQFPQDLDDVILRMDMAVRAKKIRRAQKIFKKLQAWEKTTDAYNTMFLIFSQRKMILHADDFYYKFKEAKLKPNDITFSILACLYRRCGLHNKVVRLQEDIEAAGMKPCVCFLNNLMVSKYELHGISSAEEIFNQLVPAGSDLKRSHLSTYSMMAASYLSAGMHDKAQNLLEVIEKAMDQGSFPKLRRTYHILISMYSTMKNRDGMERVWKKIEDLKAQDYVAMIESCGRADEVGSAEKYFKEADRKGLLNQPSLFAALLGVYAGKGQADKAEKLFKKMKEQDVSRDALCYHYIILANLNAKNIDRAVEILELAEAAGMRDGRSRPFLGTFCDVLKTIAKETGDVALAETLLADWRKGKYRTDIAVYNHLLRVYLKAGKQVQGPFLKRLAGNNMKPTRETHQLLQQLSDAGGEGMLAAVIVVPVATTFVANPWSRNRARCPALVSAPWLAGAAASRTATQVLGSQYIAQQARQQEEEDEEEYGAQEEDYEDVEDEEDAADELGKIYEKDEARLAGVDFSAAQQLLEAICELKDEQYIRVQRIVRGWLRSRDVEVGKHEFVYVMRRLRKRKRVKHALEIADWMALSRPRPFTLTTKDNIFRMDLASRCGSVGKAERIFERLAPEHRSEVAYNALLLSYTKKKKRGRAERLFKELKATGTISSCYSLNLLASMYRQLGLDAEVLMLAKEAQKLGVELDMCFYNLLLPAKFRVQGLEEVEKLYATITSPRDRTRFFTCLAMANIYVSAGRNDKVLEMLELIDQGMEAGTIVKQRRRYNVLISMYASLEDGARVERTWERLKQQRQPNTEDYCCIIRAWGKLGHVVRAETIFQVAEANEKSLKYSTVFNAMMFVYSVAGMREEAEGLVQRMEYELGVKLDPWCYHHLVLLYAKAGDIGKMLSTLRAAQAGGKKERRFTPLAATLWAALNTLADAGDVDTAEETLTRWKRSGYRVTTGLYNRLLRAHLVAARPTERFVERMLVDGVVPNGETEKLFNELKVKLS